ncbi:tape measure protein [Pseudomonas sp. PLB05]|uniref:tape measure protein n=1 Tax=Pseudomonas sp. PLB05 TaxID=2899078 RepID=UPI001E393BE1|nr:tape measure protein [Pseudomonas sp. PLB05]MCD4863794.1 tape measure protein [Pseudomonas sp. PLB05]
MDHKVASFFAEMGLKLNRSQFKAAEDQLNRLRALMQKIKSDFDKSFQVSPKIKFNSLAFQRDIQKSLNQISRLTEFKMSRFKIDDVQLNRSLQSAISRAQYSANSIKLKAVIDRSSVSQSARAVARQAATGEAGGGTGGVAGLVGASRAGVAGVAGYVGYEAVQGLQNQMDEIQRRVGTFQMQRLQLGAAVGGEAERRWNNVVALRQISDYTGTKAEDQVAGYTKFEKQAQQSGMNARQAIGLYKNMAVSTRGNGGDQQSVERQAYALQQVLGLGYLRGEELNQQLADSNPAIKKYIQQAYLQRVGFKGNSSEGTAKFMSDLGKRLVLVQDVLKGYDLSARNAAPRVEELANSIEGAAARLDNVKWMENLERSEGPLSDAIRDRIEAEKNLYNATIPLQEQFIKLVEIPFVQKMTEFTNSLTGLADWYNKYQKLPEDKKTDAAIDAGENVAWWAGKRLAKNNLIGTAVDNNWLGMGDGADWLKRFVLGPEQGEAGRRIVPDFKPYQVPKLNYQMPFSDFQMPSALPMASAPQFGVNPVVNTPDAQQMMQQMTQSYSSTDSRTYDNRITFEPGAFQIDATSMDVNQLGSELESRMMDAARRVQDNTLSDARIQYPSVGR